MNKRNKGGGGKNIIIFHLKKVSTEFGTFRLPLKMYFPGGIITTPPPTEEASYIAAANG